MQKDAQKAVVLSPLGLTPGLGIRILGWGLPSDFEDSLAQNLSGSAAQPIKLPGGTMKLCNTDVGFGSWPGCHPSLRSMAPLGLLAQQPVLRERQSSLGRLLGFEAESGEPPKQA